MGRGRREIPRRETGERVTTPSGHERTPGTAVPEAAAPPTAWPGEFRRHGGKLLAASIGVMASCITLVNYSIGVFVLPLTQEFGWSRQDVMLGSTTVTVGALFTSFFVGWLADRIDLARLIVASQFAFGLAFVALGVLVHDKWTFYAIFLSMAVLAGGTLPITFTKVVATSFVRHRGLALGLTLSGTGLAGLLVPPYAGHFVNEYGWRAGFAAVGALPALVAMPLALAFLRGSAPHIPRATAATRLTTATVPAEGLSFAAALRTRRFWLLCAALFLASGASTGMSTNLVPLLIDRGFAAPQAANMAATFGLAVITGRIVTGVLIDRFWAPGLVCWFIVPAAFATWFIANQPVGFGAALALIAIVGLATGAEGDLLSYLVTRYFGMREYGRIFAAVFVVFIAAIAIAAPLFGRSHDLYGSYAGSMTFAAAAWIVCGALLLTLGPYPSWGDAAPQVRSMSRG